MEEALQMKLDEYRSYFDEELIRILGQMDAPSQILDYLYLGSEWNASNLEELQQLGWVWWLCTIVFDSLADSFPRWGGCGGCVQ